VKKEGICVYSSAKSINSFAVRINAFVKAQGNGCGYEETKNAVEFNSTAFLGRVYN
jgi:hypothetical protein